MKSRDVFLPSLSSILIAGMVAFLSCAHQSRNSEDVDVPGDEAYSENETESQPASSDEALLSDSGSANELSGDLESGESSLESGESSKEGKLQAESTEDLLVEDSQKSSPSNTDPFEAELESTDSKTSLAQSTTDNSLGSESNSSELSFEDELEKDSLDSSNKAESPASGLVDSSLNSGSSASLIQPKTDELKSNETVEPEIEPLKSEEDKTQFSNTRRNKSAGIFVAGKIPKIPARAINKKGQKLNRFYFVRKGDSPTKVSQLIYGSADKAKALIKWNGKSWTPGNIIYYVSPQNAKDPKMDSFYKENEIVAEEYAIQKGDWLSKIAAKQLGDPRSWTEIAVINGIKSPRGIEVGQKIALYPNDLTTRPQQQTIANAEPVSQSPVAVQPVQPPPAVEAPPTPVQPPETEAELPVVASPNEPIKSAPVGFNPQKFIEQNLFAALMGLAGIFLVLLLLVKKKKSKQMADSDDFDNGEEGFQPPTKLKRK
ncbi:MAG: LysM peptidoglycan-binding domain-containing protein [Deltaproteobacteria bacterium]|nr:LysM peptidoglycan-binding domain-containing protein [Deltaproteobacteria bacterium]